MKKCFFIGHRDTGDEVLPYIKEAAEKLIVQEEITQFYVGGYGSFDRLAGRAMIELRRFSYIVSFRTIQQTEK